MNMKLIRLFFLCVISLCWGTSTAQVLTKDEYKAEIGLTGGGSYYLGDANKTLFNNMELAYGGFFRYILNPRFALKAELLRTSVLSPGLFDNSIYIGDITAEFNFFDLDRNSNKRFTKTFSPYIFTGVGGMTAVYDNQRFPVISLPFGIGMKVKLAKRWNLNAQWTTRLALWSDNLEGFDPDVDTSFNNPNGLNGSNLFNNDLLSTITVGVSYDIWKKECDCANTNYKSSGKGRKTLK